MVGEGAVTVRVVTPAAHSLSPGAQEAPREVAGGLLYRVRPPADAVELTVTAGTARYVLPLRREPPSPELLKLRSLRKANDVAGLRAALPTVPDALRGRALGLLGRAERAVGETDAAIRSLGLAIARHRADGRVSDEAAAGRVLVFTLISANRFNEARRALDAQAPLDALDPKARLSRPYYAGVLARKTGDLRAAQRHYRVAETAALSMGEDRLVRNARQGRALIAQALGRLREASGILEDMLAATSDPCELAPIWANIGFGRLQARDRGEASADPAEPLRRAAKLYARACARPVKRALALTNLALIALQDGAPTAARRYHAQASEKAEPWARRWLLDIKGRIALAEARPLEALAAYDELATRSALSVDPSDLWRAQLGRARALAAQGHVDAAIEAHGRAEAHLDTALLRVPIQEGRAGWLGGREPATTHQLMLRLTKGDNAGALNVVRRARARALRSAWRTGRIGALGDADRARWDRALAEYREARADLDAEAAGDWQIAAADLPERLAGRAERARRLTRALDAAATLLPGPDPLPALPDDALTLAWFPGDEGWIGFAATPGSVTVARGLDPRDPAGLLRPFRARFATARRIRVLPYGPLRRIDFHAVRLDPRETMLDHPPVLYGLDLGAPSGPPKAGPNLLVADTRLDLAAARRTADALAPLLDARTLVGAAATPAAVRAALSGSRSLHFAGHGEFAGVSGWDSALVLAGGRLTVGDVLALRRVPSEVVLAGCETARSSETAAESIGLGQAFAMAGALQVVASRRAVDDAVTARISTAIHAARARDPGLDLAGALQIAQRSNRGEKDWASFRTLAR